MRSRSPTFFFAPSCIVAGLLALTVIGSFGCAAPPLTKITPGVVPTLAEGEGLLVVDIDTDAPIKSIRAFGGIQLGAVPKGRHTWILAAREGEYRWDRVAFSEEVGGAAAGRSPPGAREFSFDVEAGKLNYPGEIIIRASRVWGFARMGWRVRNRNHSAMAIRELRKSYASILEAFPLRYAGPTEDAFLEHYTEVRRLSRSENVTLLAPVRVDAPPSGLSADQLFSSDGIHTVDVSPDGQWAIAHAQNGESHGVLVQKLGSMKVHSSIVAKSFLLSLGWIGPDTFLATFQSATGPRSMVGRINDVGGEPDVSRRWIDAPGAFVHGLPLDGEHVVWQFYRRGKNTANRVEIADLTGYKKARTGAFDPTTLGEQLARLDSPSVRWIVDRKGMPRVAFRRDEEAYSIHVRGKTPREFRQIYSFEEDDEKRKVIPLSVAVGGHTLIVAAYDGHDTLGLMEMDMRDGSLGETLLRKDDVDVTHIVRDPISGELIAGVYSEAGDERFHYFDSATTRRIQDLDGALDTDRVAVASSSADRKTLALFVSNSTNPGQYLLYDARNGRSTVLGRSRSRVERGKLVEGFALTARAPDGPPVEAYLTVPDPAPGRSTRGVPLVVIPHGGPIGVKDTLGFNPLVQYLASWGFAVLQVNYRGSSGYGIAFEEAGKKQWAQAIEDDIDAAVEVAMARTEIDRSRVCIVGGSYGGFSALAGIVRHTDRYRCAASINGVTDIPLMFESSDFADFEKRLEAFSEVAGDVEKEREKLTALSPLYDVAKMQVPVFVAYGTEDRRVDPDHAHRLLLMLETFDKPHGMLEIRDGAHSPSLREWVLLVRSLRRFLTENLYAAGSFTPDPQSATSGFDVLVEIQP